MYTQEELNEILTEIASYEVELEEDPTLPELGTRYLQKSIAQCRNFMNRVQFYLQKVGLMEKNLKVKVQLLETDIEFKINGLLADDPVVRQQPSISDRRALAIAKLKQEHEKLASEKIKLTDIQETLKLLKMKYGDLRATNGDLKAQRQLVKDDMTAWTEGGEGYTPLKTKPNGTFPDGMPPPVVPKINPSDILDPKSRPDDLPEPKDEVHAEQIASFFNTPTLQKPKSAPSKAEELVPIAKPAITYDDLLKD